MNARMYLTLTFLWLSLLFPKETRGDTWQPVFAGDGWRLQGRSGQFRQFTLYGLAFDLVQVSAVDSPDTWLWAAAGVTLSDGRYLSFVQGVGEREDILRAFSTPGLPLTLQIRGAMATPAGVDWDRCQPPGSDFCRLAQLVEHTAPTYGDLPLQGPSNLFIHRGCAPRHPHYGFFIWEIVLPFPRNIHHERILLSPPRSYLTAT